MTYYAIVTFGAPTMGTRRSYYTNLKRAIADARSLGGGTMSNVRIVECSSRQDALDADISQARDVVWQR